jgi:hypothetical protein
MGQSSCSSRIIFGPAHIERAGGGNQLVGQDQLGGLDVGEAEKETGRTCVVEQHGIALDAGKIAPERLAVALDRIEQL